MSSKLTRFADVKEKPIRWLWDGHLPKGMMTLIEGWPEAGKGWFTMDIAARVSRGGQWPDGQGYFPKGNVLLITSEDPLEEVLLQRWRLLEGDRDRMFHHPMFTYNPSDPKKFQKLVEETNPSLIVIDPLPDVLPTGTNVNQANEIRPILDSLLAQCPDAATLFVRHWGKSSDRDARMMGLGSIGYMALARVMFAIVHKEQDGGSRVISQVKNNLGPRVPSLVYRVQDGVQWLGLSDESVDDVLRRRGKEEAAEPTSTLSKRELDRAKEFILSFLEDGPQSSLAVKKEARRGDLNWFTVDRASRAMGVKKRRRGDHWEWSLMESNDEES